MARGRPAMWLHDRAQRPMVEPCLALWCAVLLKALDDAGSLPGSTRGQAREFLRGSTGFTLRSGVRVRAVDQLLAVCEIDLDCYRTRILPCLERHWRDLEPRMAALGETRRERIAAAKRARYAEREAA